MPFLYALTSARWRGVSVSNVPKNGIPSPIRIGTIE